MSTGIIKMTIIITRRGYGEKVISKFKEGEIGFHYVCHGLGTVSSEVLEYLGVGEAEKDVVFSITHEKKVQEIMQSIRDGIDLGLPDRGIICSLDVTAASKIVDRTIRDKAVAYDDEEVQTVDQDNKYSMIISVVNRGYTDEVMDAAKKVGARGGTVIHARGIGTDEAGKFLGVALQPEKEIIMIVARQKEKTAIMSAISQAAGIHTKAHGFLISLPVEEFTGIG